MDFGKNSKFWRQFPFLRSAVDRNGQLIIPNPDVIDGLSARIATYSDLNMGAGKGSSHGRDVCASSCQSVHLLDADGRVVRTLKESVNIESLDHHRFKAQYTHDGEMIGEALFTLGRDEIASILYFVIVDQEYASLAEEGYCATELTVIIVPSKQALLHWVARYGERDSASSELMKNNANVSRRQLGR